MLFKKTMTENTCSGSQVKIKGRSVKSKTYGLYFLIPGLLIYFSFFILPSFAGLILSFFNVRTFRLSGVTYAGLDNYKRILSDHYLYISIKNTLIFAFVTTVGKVGFGLILALFVNHKFRGVRYLRTILFLPAVLNNVAVGLVFRAMMHPSTGLINRFLKAAGLANLAQNWLTDPKIAIFSSAFVEIWKWTGFTMVILLAGLQSIDASFYEAAKLDGATAMQQFRYITFHLMMPAFTNALVVNMVGGLKVFDIVQALTKGGPGSASSVFGTIIFSSFGDGSYGVGCAASIILCISVLLIVLPTYKFFSNKEVEIS
jgi:raffinose/stachyose/melibiose transport system permease protein